tara:strand:- start:179 stop:367 length:189 start_codon:yes stop_codon:yes gene_type:complete
LTYVVNDENINKIPMTWDYTLLKKYNSTNHFKLIKQLRNDLKINGNKQNSKEKREKNYIGDE